MHQMGEARLQASRAILSYVVPSASELIDQVRKKVAAGGLAGLDSAAGGADIELLEVLGEGAYGKVYKGLWRGTVCAVKSILLPASISGAEKRDKMAFSVFFPRLGNMQGWWPSVVPSCHLLTLNPACPPLQWRWPSAVPSRTPTSSRPTMPTSTRACTTWRWSTCRACR